MNLKPEDARPMPQSRALASLAQDLARRAEMEELVAAVSRSFVGLGPGELDLAVRRALAAIGEFVQADRSYVFLYDRPARLMSNTHEWCSPGTPPQRDALQRLALDDFAWILERAEREPVIDIPHVQDMPPQAAAEKAHFLSQGIRSLIMVSMRNPSGQVIGFIGFDSVRTTRPWHEEDRHLLMVTGDLVAAAVEHQALMRRLTESENQVRATLEALPDLLLLIDRAGVIVEARAPLAKDLPWAVAAVPGANIDTLISGRQLRDVRAAVRALRQGAAVAEFDLDAAGPAGLRHFEGRLTQHSPGLYLALLRDATARRRAEDALKDLALQLTAAEEVHRRALSLQLHDGIGQELAGLNLRLQALAERSPDLQGELLRAIAMLQETIRRTQDLTFDLSPPALYELGLGPALGALVRRLNAEEGPRYSLESPAPGPELGTEASVLMYRIARELLANAAKHAHAATVRVTLAADGEAALLEVADDGVGMPHDGFGSAPRAGRGGFGLFSIRQRLQPLGGAIQIHGDSGTRIVVTLPCRRSAATREVKG